MAKVRRRATLLAVAAIMFVTGGLAAVRVQAEGEPASAATICAGIPAFLAAYDYTMQTWPNAAPADDLTYFTASVRADQTWCAGGSKGSALAVQTAGWHFGQAGAALAEYQRIAREVGSTPAPAAPTVTPTPSAVAGTRENPAPMGTTVNLSGNWQVRVLSVVPNANGAVAQTNQFNSPPKPGHQFFIARVQANYTGDGSTRFSGRSRLKAVGPAAVSYSTFSDSCGVIPDPLPDPETFKGGTFTGNVCWQIRSEDAASLVMYDDPLFGGSAATRIYMALQ